MTTTSIVDLSYETSEGFGSKTNVDHEETVSSYHSDKEASDNYLTDGTLNASQYSLPVETPLPSLTISGSNSPSNSIPTSTEYACPALAPCQKVDGRSREEIDFIRIKLDVLARRSLSKVNRVPVSHTSTGSADNPIAAEFCKQCVKVNCQNGIGLHVRQQPGVRPTRDDIIIFSRDGQIERLRLEAQQSKMKAKIACIRNESLCTQTRDTHRARAAMAEKTFVCHRTQAAGQEEFNSRLNYHLLYKDSTSLLAEVIRSCTRPQASSEEVWRAMWRTQGRGMTACVQSLSIEEQT